MKIFKPVILTLLSLLAFLPLSAMNVSDVPNVHVADRSLYVSDAADLLSPQAEAQLNSAIGQLWRDSSVELVVVTVPEVEEGTTPDEFATRLFEQWGIGKSDNDNGILLLVSAADRKAVIRTGYGAEGALPDVVAGRIIRTDIVPNMKRGDANAAVAAATARIAAIVRDPSVADELMSSHPSDAPRGGDGPDLFNIYLIIAATVGAGMFLMALYMVISSRRLPDVERWRVLQKYKLTSLAVTFLTLGFGLPAMLLLYGMSHRVRRHKRRCTHCGTRMQLIDEVHDNDFLNPAQDLEERIGSVDYDVWHCPKCAQTDILPYANTMSDYKECPVCHARTLRLTDRRVLRQPTTRTEGEGVDIFVCRNCGGRSERRFRIERKDDVTGAAAAGAVLGSMFGGTGSHGGGGGFSGGSFGGGNTGGGGASGDW